VDSKHWRPLSSDTSLKCYSQPLHALAQAVLLTLDDHPSGYHFPVAPSTALIGKKLLAQLKKTQESDNKLVALFHTFVFPLLCKQQQQQPQPQPRQQQQQQKGPHNKWQVVLECFMAMYTLGSDGNWDQTAGVTQLFAMLKYSCPSAILYQASIASDQFENDLYRCALFFSRLGKG
jgi:hypothetical protein